MSQTLTANVSSLFAQEISKGISLIVPSKATVPYMEISPDEADAINSYLNVQLEILKNNAPVLYSIVEPQKSLVTKVAGMFKAAIQGKSTYAFPPSPGNLGVAFAIPELIQYASGVPTSYLPGSWRIPTTAGTPVYPLGSSTAYYTSSSTENQRAFLLIFQNGLAEVNTTPTYRQMQVTTQTSPNWGPMTIEPMVDVYVEKGKSYYVYPTPGAIIVPYNVGVKMGLMPYKTVPDGVDTRLIGVVFYEYNFYSNLVY